MYCSSCGASVARGLSYCNLCGAKLSGGKGEGASKASELRAESLVFGMIAVFVFGLAAIMGLMTAMKGVLAEPFILVVTMLSFVIMFLLEVVFLWLLLRRNRGAKAASNTMPKEQSTKELDAAHVRALPDPIPSVTEHTTQTFDPVYSERKSK